jgi:DNA-binding MarR family transcriptional regulator
MSTTSSDERGAVAPDTTELAEAVESFMGAFMHWARAQVSLSGTSYSRMRLLYELHCDGPQKMADLADGLGVTPRNVTALVDGLEAEGLVRRTDHPTDRRVTIIELTGEAPDAGEVFETYRASVARLFATLSADDRREYLRLTRILDARLRAGDGERVGDPATVG